MVKVPAAPTLISNADIRENDIFISYDSEDIVFVENLEEALSSQKLQIWKIGKNLPIHVSPTAPEAWKYTAAGIENSHIFVFVISPKSVVSPKNLAELELAVRCEKHLVPICCREVNDESLPEALSDREKWVTVDSLKPDSFEPVAKRLNQVHIHIRLSQRAKEWEVKGQPQSLLLGKKDLESVKDWMSQTIDKQLQLTKLQQDYINASLHEVGKQQVPHSDVFISYSRKDKPFVEKLCAALRDEGISFWVDWENIPIAAPWRVELAEGIKNADNFLFVMSADSVASKYCYDEIRQAADEDFHKRIITLVLRRDYDRAQVHPAAKERHWLYLDQCENPFESLEAALPKLIEAIKKNENYVKIHTTLLLRALEWSGREYKYDGKEHKWVESKEYKRDSAVLLSGTRLREAIEWLDQSEGKEPEPTKLHRDFIQASKKRRNQQRIIGAVGSTALVGIASSLLLGFSFKAAGEIQALVSSLDNRLEIDALVVSLKAGKDFQFLNLGWLFNKLDPGSQAQVVTALHKAIYNLNEQNRLEAHQGRVYAVRYNNDGSFIASAAQDGTVRFWNSDGTSSKVPLLEKHEKDVVSIDFSPKDQILASASYDGTVKLWRITKTFDGKTPVGELIKTLSGHKDRVYQVRFSPNGQRMASASIDGTVNIWTATGELVSSLPHKSPVYSIDFSSDSKTLASASLSGVQLWTGSSFEKSKLLFQTSQDYPFWVRFSPVDQHLISSGFSTSNTAKLWKQDGTLVKELKGHEGRINRMEFSHDGRIVASASADHTVRLWDAENGALIQILRAHQDSVYRVQFSHNDKDKIIATAGADDTIKIWKQEKKGEWSLSNSFVAHKNEVMDIDFSHDDQRLVSASADGTVRLWQLTNKYVTRLPHQNIVQDVSFSPNSEFIVSSGVNNIRFWKPDGTAINSIDAHQGKVTSISLSSDGKLLVSAGEDGKIKLWQIAGEDGKLLQKPLPKKSFEGHQGAISSVSLNANGKLLASAQDKTVRLRELDGTFDKKLQGHEGDVTSVAFSPDNQLLVSASKKAPKDNSNGEIILWGLDEMPLTKVKDFQGKLLGDILSVSVSPAGKFVVAADSSDNTVKLWRLIRTANGSAQLKPVKLLEGHTAPVLKLTYSPKTNLLASASQDGTVKLWTEEGDLITTVRKHRREVSSVSFSPDGQFLASASDDRDVFLYRLPDEFDVDKLMKQGCDLLAEYLTREQTIELSERQIFQQVRQYCRSK